MDIYIIELVATIVTHVEAEEESKKQIDGVKVEEEAEEASECNGQSKGST